MEKCVQRKKERNAAMEYGRTPSERTMSFVSFRMADIMDCLSRRQISSPSSSPSVPRPRPSNAAESIQVPTKIHTKTAPTTTSPPPSSPSTPGIRINLVSLILNVILALFYSLLKPTPIPMDDTYSFSKQKRHETCNSHAFTARENALDMRLLI